MISNNGGPDIICKKCPEHMVWSIYYFFNLTVKNSKYHFLNCNLMLYSDIFPQTLILLSQLCFY